jgi:integrase
MVSLSLDGDEVKGYVDALAAVHEKYAILALVGLFSGLRVSEVLSLKVSDVGAVWCVFQPKTQKHKTFILPDEIQARVNAYVTANGLGADDALIPSTVRNPQKSLSRQQAFTVLRREARNKALQRVGTHSMRKTYANALYRATGRVDAVQDALGHDSPFTTLAYLVDMAALLK